MGRAVLGVHGVNKVMALTMASQTITKKTKKILKKNLLKILLVTTKTTTKNLITKIFLLNFLKFLIKKLKILAKMPKNKKIQLNQTSV